MKRFLALYLLFLGILFALLYAPESPLAYRLNAFQSELTLWMLGLFLDATQLVGNKITINPHYKIIITQACNGMIPILFLVAPIFAYPASLKSKIAWSLVGYVVFTAVNVMRILWVVYVTQHGEGQKEFYWSHDLVGNTLLILTGLVLFVLFIKFSAKSS